MAAVALDELDSLFLGLVDDLGLGGSPLLVGRERSWFVETLDSLFRVSQLLGSLGTRHDDSLERNGIRLRSLVEVTG